MTDDELIERLRRTLHTEAAALAPTPADHPTATYTVPAPAHGRRRRWPLLVAATAAAAAAVTLAVLNWPGGGTARIGLVGTGPSTSRAPSSTVPSVAPSSSIPPATTTAQVPSPAPATSIPAPVTGGAQRSPAATLAPTGPSGGAALAASFQPEAVTFVSPLEGWVAGQVSCGSRGSGGSGECVAMAHTTNGGRTWAAAPAPQATVATVATVAGVSGAGAVSVRFADPKDGWISAVNPTRLWSTHDGGSTWQQVHPAGLSTTATITAMATSGGYVWVAVIPTNAATVHLEGSPVDTDAWTDLDTGVSIGAGPIPATQLVLQGRYGWLLQDDRTVIGGARLNGTGQWLPWTPPCRTANGTAALAASSPAALVAMCEEGAYGPPGNLPPGVATAAPSSWLFASSDGGNSFQPVGAVAAGPNPPSGVASPAPATILRASTQPNGSGEIGVLSASFNHGHTWRTVLQVPSVIQWTDLGFTTVSQGVVIASTQSGSTFYMTRDGGQTWTPAIW